MPEVSVVIPVLNGAATLSAQLEAVLEQEGVSDFEVVVVDNGSSDGTVPLVRAYAKLDRRVRFVDGSAAPRGAAAARNLGVEATRSELLAFCDADDLVRPGWLCGLVRSLREHPIVCVTREYWSLNPSLRGFQRERTGRETFLGSPSLSGGAFGIRKDVYQNMGGFDETLARAEDTEFGLRLHRAGYEFFDAVGPEISIRLPVKASEIFQRARLLAQSRPYLQARYGGELPRSGRQLSRLALALVVRSYRYLDPDQRVRRAKLAGSVIGEIEGRLRCVLTGWRKQINGCRQCPGA